MTGTDDFMETWQRHKAAVTKANGLNKTIVFEALSAAGITRVVANFDGAGDSGQIEDATAYAGDKLVDFPATTVTLYRAQSGSEELTTQEMSLREAVEALCYGYLEQEHDGWEINDGAFGQFTFDVAKREIALDFNGRFSEYVQHDYTF
jgi:hypothetical protein